MFWWMADMNNSIFKHIHKILVNHQVMLLWDFDFFLLTVEAVDEKGWHNTQSHLTRLLSNANRRNRLLTLYIVQRSSVETLLKILMIRSSGRQLKLSSSILGPQNSIIIRLRNIPDVREIVNVKMIPYPDFRNQSTEMYLGIILSPSWQSD